VGREGLSYKVRLAGVKAPGVLFRASPKGA